MKHNNYEKKTILIGIVGIVAMIFSIYVSWYFAVIKHDIIPLIIFTTTCIYSEFRETYKLRRDKEDHIEE